MSASLRDGIAMRDQAMKRRAGHDETAVFIGRQNGGIGMIADINGFSMDHVQILYEFLVYKTIKNGFVNT